MEKSLSLIAKKSKESCAESRKEIPNMKDAPQPKIKKNSSLKGISQSLIEKVLVYNMTLHKYSLTLGFRIIIAIITIILSVNFLCLNVRFARKKKRKYRSR